jgi:hypothetical protein
MERYWNARWHPTLTDVAKRARHGRLWASTCGNPTSCSRDRTGGDIAPHLFGAEDFRYQLAGMLAMTARLSEEALPTLPWTTTPLQPI